MHAHPATSPALNPAFTLTSVWVDTKPYKERRCATGYQPAQQTGGLFLCSREVDVEPKSGFPSRLLLLFLPPLSACFTRAPSALPPCALQHSLVFRHADLIKVPTSVALVHTCCFGSYTCTLRTFDRMPEPDNGNNRQLHSPILLQSTPGARTG